MMIFNFARANALVALSKVPKDASKFLSKIITLLKDEDPIVRGNAVTALSSMGSDADSAIEELRYVSQNHTERKVTRKAAREAVKRIQGS